MSIGKVTGGESSLTRAGYMGGARDGAESPKFNQSNLDAHVKYLKDQNQALDTSFDAPVAKAQTHMQQPDASNRLGMDQPPSPSIKIPSQIPSQSDCSQSARRSKPNQKGKKKPDVPQQDLLREHRIKYRKHARRA